MSGLRAALYGTESPGRFKGYVKGGRQKEIYCKKKKNFNKTKQKKKH